MNNESITDICNEFNLFINDIANEANMAILATKYNFICENGYEMPIHEAEEKKENILKRMINTIVQKLRDFKDKIIVKMNDLSYKYKNSKFGKYIAEIHNSHKQAEANIKNSETPEEAKEEAKKGIDKLKNITTEAKKDMEKTNTSQDNKVPVAPDEKDMEKTNTSQDNKVPVAPDEKPKKQRDTIIYQKAYNRIQKYFFKSMKELDIYEKNETWIKNRFNINVEKDRVSRIVDIINEYKDEIKNQYLMEKILKLGKECIDKIEKRVLKYIATHNISTVPYRQIRDMYENTKNKL